MLDELERRSKGKRAVVLAIGNPLRGDDGFGPRLADRLQGKVAATIVDAGDVPENYVGVVKAAQPEIVVIVDAADFGAVPGDAAIIGPEDLVRARFSTHNAGLGPFLSFLQAEVPSDILVIGVQPATTAYGAPISPVVQRAIETLEKLLVRCWPVARTSA